MGQDVWSVIPTAEERNQIEVEFEQHRDPWQVPGYCEDVPSKDWTCEPLFRFNYRPSADYGEKGFYCCTCNNHKKFRNGIAAWYSDGHIRLIGNQCGREFYIGVQGREFARKIREMDAARRRAERLQKWPKIVETCILLRTALAKFSASAEIPALFKFRAELQSRTATLWPILARCAERGQLIVERRLAQPRRVGARLEEFEEVVVGTLRGGTALLGMNNPRRLADAALNIVRRAADIDFGSLSDNKQLETITLLNDAVSYADEAAQIMDLAAQFAAAANLSLICQWATGYEQCDGAYRMSGRNLRWERPGSETAVVGVPTFASTPKVMPAIEDLRVALTR